MSSHHIVKDQQEPTLIIDRWDHIYNLLLNELLEWLPRIICQEPIIEKILSLGIKIDAITIEPSTKEYWLKKISDQLPLELIFSPKKSFLTASMKALIEKGYREVNVLTDKETFTSVLEKIIPFQQLNSRIYAGGQRTIVYRSPIFQKWMTAGERIKIWSSKKGCFSTEGFQKDLRDWATHEEVLRVKEDGLKMIRSDQNLFFITEYI